MKSITTPLSADYRINSLLIGQQWGPLFGEHINLSYSIPQGNTYWVEDYAGNEPSNWSALNSSQINAFRMTLNAWAEVANITFIEVDDELTYGDIRIAFSQIVSDNPTAAGWAYIPGEPDESGDIWLDRFAGGTYQPTSFGYTTVLHELGHALGLAHPFESKDNNDSLLVGVENTSQYSIMSNNDFDGVGSTFTTTGPNSYNWYPVQPTTPMLYDLLAIQYLYGANLTTRTGDDTYVFSNSRAELQTIWDAGGSDTFDLSNQNTDLRVDLNDGRFSSIGIKETWDDNLGIVVSAANDNIAIAYDAIIENVIGGAGDDILTGNQFNNQLKGGLGSNILIGGQGIDTAIYDGSFSDYFLANKGFGQLTVSTSATGENDTLSEVEWLQFNDQLVATAQYTENTPQNPDEVVLNPQEGNENHINYFLLSLPETLSIDATVNYRTLDGSAIAGEDYIASSGLALIEAGKTSTLIGVEIIADNIQEADETFFLEVSNPVGGQFPEHEIVLTAMRTIINDDFI